MAESAEATLKLKTSSGSHDELAFVAFATQAEPRLRRALLGSVGADRMPDAVGEALAYGWQHWDRVKQMANPVGYLYRVGQSKVRQRKRPRLFAHAPPELPDVEPGLTAALLGLPHQQRAAVWLAYGCEWTRSEIGEALGISASTVGSHIDRGMRTLRKEIGAIDD